MNRRPRRADGNYFVYGRRVDSYKYVYEYEAGGKIPDRFAFVHQGTDGRLRAASKEEMYDY